MPLPSSGPAICTAPQRKGCRLFALGALLGIAVFLLLLGPRLLDVTDDALVRGGYIERDIQQHYAGWLFYRQSALAFPLCIAQGIGGPNGLSVAFTDSIPLVAALCRLLAPLLPATFQYFGWFTLLCFALQGGFAALLCGLFAQGYLTPLLGSGVFCLSPVLLERVLRHTSLGAQWLVLAALYCYFRARRGGDVRGAYRLLFVLNVLTVGIHPYFVPMTYSVTLALLLEEGLHRHKLPQAALYLGADLAATAALGWAIGLFAGGSGAADASYGYFAMNLNALWNPAGVNGVDWSLFLPVQNQVRGNYDAFAYLGIGVWAGLGAAFCLAVKQRRCLVSALKRHWALLAVCAVLTVFAVSHVVTANGATLFTLPLPPRLLRLCSIFRSGGRMFWVPYYLLMLAAFLAVVRLGGQRGAVLCAAALLAVQAADLAPGLAQRHAAVAKAYAEPAFPTAMKSDFWDLAAGRYKTIASMDELQYDALHLALWAFDKGMTTNDPFTARYDQAALEAQRAEMSEELAQGRLRADTLYLFGTEAAFLRAAEQVQADAWCGSVDGQWYAIAPGLQDAAPEDACQRYDADTWPLRIADYSDAIWLDGVLTTDRRIVCFYDTPFARARLAGATALRADGRTWPILLVDDHDPGWLMVTLDIEDASILCEQVLEAVP